MEFVKTADGSKTLYHEQVGEHYHSIHGAQQESVHVFLNTGLRYWLEKEDSQSGSVLEVGFGTGLNFLLTAEYCTENHINLDYIGVEAYPLDKELVVQSEYNQFISRDIWNEFIAKYISALKSKITLNPYIHLEIMHQKIMAFQNQKKFDVIYFDAFAEIHQPEMWSSETLEHVSRLLKPGGVFVTYAITGNLKRRMKALGFSIEKAPGAPGKREMLRATKL